MHKKIQNACSKIAPLWPLTHFVAVNPFLGFTNQSFEDTAHTLKQVRNADLVMPLSWYRDQHQQGNIRQADFEAAYAKTSKEIHESFESAGLVLSPESIPNLLNCVIPEEEPCAFPQRTFSGYLDNRKNTRWAQTLREEVAKWCAAYFDQGQANWNLQNASEDFYTFWHRLAQHDRNLSCAGLAQAHARLSRLPATSHAAIEAACAALAIPSSHQETWFYENLVMIPGWAGYLQYLDREASFKGNSSHYLEQLLAVILNYEHVLSEYFTEDTHCILGWKRIFMEEAQPHENASSLPFDLALRLFMQNAYEHSIQRKLRAAIQPPIEEAHTSTSRKDIQAVFCIDVRSEPFRRALEAQHPSLQTLGFAGFFGVPLNHLPEGQAQGQSRCPALLAPSVSSAAPCGCADHAHTHAVHKSAHNHDKVMKQTQTWRTFREAAASCFSFVETLGLSYVRQLTHDSLGLKNEPSHVGQPSLTTQLTLEAKVQLAGQILKGLSLTRDFARIILLCGHGSETRNNPYASGLDCGACGGHAGDVNARIAATLLNEPAVRQGLAAEGIHIPEDCIFIAGLHNTTTDEVTLFCETKLSVTHSTLVHTLQTALDRAGEQTLQMRAPKLNTQAHGDPLIRQVRARSRDWSQPRPEWGLAGNTGFIVAPRSWTQNSDLAGRAFLHDYAPELDPEGNVLEAILGGPLVVGSWINLQYYGSTTDNKHFGSGHKAIHNVIGGIGAALGNENDLQTGLPLQSVHDGKTWVHKPSRLHALVATDLAMLDTILARQPTLASLVNNGWLHLFSLGRDGTQWTQYKKQRGSDVSRRPTKVSDASFTKT